MANSVSIHPYVIVHVWKPESVDKTQKRSKKAVGPSFGHVALETRTGTLEDRCVHYISFWPPGKCHATDQSHFHSFIDDRNYETRPPDASYEITFLDVAKINATFEKFLQRPFQWKVFGSGIFRKKYASNCSGFVMHLLEKGGIREIVPDNQELKRNLALISLLSLVTLFYFKNPLDTGIFGQLTEMKRRIEPNGVIEPYFAYLEHNRTQVLKIQEKCKVSSDCQVVKPLVNEIIAEDTKTIDTLSLLINEKKNKRLFS